MTLLMLLSLIGQPTREIDPLPSFPTWHIRQSIGEGQLISGIRLSMNNVSQEQWSELSNALSDIGMRKQSESINRVLDDWFIEEKREGSGLKASIIYVMAADTVSVSISIERCEQCTA